MDDYYRSWWWCWMKFFFFFMFGRLLHLKFVRGGFELLRSGNAVHRLPIPQRSQLLWRRRHHVRQYVYSLNHLSLVFSCRILSESPPLQTIVVLCLSFSCRMKIVYDCFIHFSILFFFLSFNIFPWWTWTRPKLVFPLVQYANVGVSLLSIAMITINRLVCSSL